MFGLPQSETQTGQTEFLDRISIDARSGFWKITTRKKGADDVWFSEESDPFQHPTMLFDFGGMESGWAKTTKPPAFIYVPYGQPVPPKPQEQVLDDNGKNKDAFQAGFRIKVMGRKVFGDDRAYYFSSTSKTVMKATWDLYEAFAAAPEAAAGKLPVVSAASNSKNTITTPKGSQSFYAPIFKIEKWVDRPEAIFGPRAVPAPSVKSMGVTMAPSAPAPAPQPTPVPEPKRELVEDEVPF
jgi:hypothetical protein